MRKRRVLQVGGGPLIKRGVEKYLENINVNLDHEKIVMDVLTPTVCLDNEFRRIIEDSEGKIIELRCKKNKMLYYIDFYIKFKKVLKDQHYDVIEAQTGAIPIMALSAIAGYRSHINKIIVHTHNTHVKNQKYWIQTRLFWPLIKKADYYYACSMKAGRDSFPKSVHSKIQVIPNAINVQDYKFDSETRRQMREKLNVENQFVVGHIGAFTTQKNHNFLVDIFESIQKQKKDSVLLLIGEGELEEEIRKKVKQHGLENQVIFYGATNNICDLLCCMDVFVFPSIWEGLGIAVVEAQASGLPCFYSEDLPQEVQINSNCFPISIECTSDEWATRILSFHETETRELYNKNLEQSDFSIYKVTSDLEKMYLSEGDQL